MRIVIPTARGLLHPRTREWGEKHGAEFIDVGADREAYWRLLRDMWLDACDFLLVEQDNVPPPGAIEWYEKCPRVWCRNWSPGGYVARFRKELMVALPKLFCWKDPRFPNSAPFDYINLIWTLLGRLAESGHSMHEHATASHSHDHHPKTRDFVHHSMPPASAMSADEHEEINRLRRRLGLSVPGESTVERVPIRRT